MSHHDEAIIIEKSFVIDGNVVFMADQSKSDYLVLFNKKIICYHVFVY